MNFGQSIVEIQMEGATTALDGKVLFREASGSTNLPKGKKLMLVLGVVLVDKDFVIEPESMVKLKGFTDKKSLCIYTHPNTEKLAYKYCAWTFNDLVTEPIWKF